MEFHGADAPAAHRFYSRMFGWEFQELPGYTFPYHAIQSEGENIGGMAADGQSAPHWLAYIGVSDISAAADKTPVLGARNGRETRGFGGGGERWGLGGAGV